MAQGVINLNQPERELTRSELSLKQLAEAWRYQPRGEQFVAATVSFFKSIDSRNTLSVYLFSVLQAFAFFQRRDGRVPTPDRVTRGDAAEFNRWLRTRDQGLTKWWLERDPERRFDLQIFEVVARNPGIGIEELRRQLGTYTPNARSRLAVRLACLVKRRTLERTPSVEEYRREHGGVVVQPPDEIFKYSVPVVHTPAGAERASTVATRLSALSALWDYMIRSGENIPGSTQSLLVHNIWDQALRQARSQAPSHQEAARQRKKTTLELFFQLLATTFTRTHGDRSLAAAQAAFRGQSFPAGSYTLPSYRDVRDRALLLFMAQTGARAHEIKRLQRRHVTGEPPLVTLLGKRGKKRTLMVPPPALGALRELSAKLRQMARHQERHGRTGRAERLLAANAPLFPAVAYWGANAGQIEGGLTRPGIALMLRRRAEAAGIDPKTSLMDKIHPHGLRALFITHALATGTPIHRVQAIVGHASAATTGRYAEERAPELLIADVFRTPPAVPSPALPSLPVEPPPQASVWEPAREPIRPPAPPPPPKPKRREPELVQRREVVEEIAPISEQMPPEREQVPQIAPPKPKRMRRPATALGQVVSALERYRGSAITKRERSTLKKCEAITDEALRNLCVIYDIHWGEAGNRQALVSTGGGKARAAKAKRGGVFEQNVFRVNVEDEWDDDEFDEEYDELDEDDEEYEEEEIDIDAELQELEERGLRRIAEIARSGETELVAETGTDRLNRIYSGKESGLSWWTGTQGRLKPEMPVMSPDQIGMCTPGEESAICAGLVKLWRQWFDESPTKAEALVKWLGEAMDTAAQMESEVSKRGGIWVTSRTSWQETRFTGPRRQPEPRMVFREHLGDEVVAWFQARAGQYQTSAGDPERWAKKTEKAKVRGEMVPKWYAKEDPVRALGDADRAELLDWILALSDQPPRDRTGRFSAEGNLFKASRVDVAEFVRALCMFDGSIDQLRDQRKREQQEFGRSSIPGPFWGYTSVDEFPASVRRDFQTLQSQARQAVSRGTGGRANDFDAFNAIKRRVRGREQPGESRSQRRAPWYLNLVRKFFGADAANDEVIKLAARCGAAPLKAYKDMFRVSGGTIEHTANYKRAFAEAFHVHSECVARRIARQLWEIRQGRAVPKEAITRPQHMKMLVDVSRTFRVPCTERQERELRGLVPFSDRPEGIYQEWTKARTVAGPERDELSEAEAQEKEMSEQFEEQIMRELRAEHFGTFEENPRRYGQVPTLPTPVHLMMALV